ncbi:MAG: peptidylprolyl isomerase [Armatimonadetes bacterium]|nr:peptidylprolyl isomerase [Armatimonadota bacterium]
MSLVRMRRKMRRAIRPVMFVFALVFAVGAVYVFTPTTAQFMGAGSTQEEFATVNGVPIQRLDFQQRIEEIMRGQALPISMQFFMTRMAWDGAVEDVIRSQGAQKIGVSVSDGEVRQQTDAMIDARLQQEGEGLSPKDQEERRSQLRSAVIYQPDTVRRQLLRQRLQEALTAKARPVEVRVSHVLINLEKRTPEQALQQARSIAQQLRGGADIAALARARSDDAGSKDKGGDVGWVTPRSSFVPEFLGAALQLKKGQVSDPVRSEFGYHVLKAMDERPWQPTEKGADKWSPEERRRKQEEYQQSVGQAIARGFVEELKRSARIEPRSPFVKGVLLEEQTGGDALSMAFGAPADAKPLGEKEQQVLRQAAEQYELALGEGGSETVGLEYHLGQIYTRLKDWPKAEAVLRKALDRSAAAEIYLQLGEVYREMGRKPDAVKAYQDASRNAYDQGSLHDHLAKKFRELGRKDLAAAETRLYAKYQKEQEAERQRQEQLRKQAEKQAREAEAKAKKEAAEKARQAAKAAASTPNQAANAPAPANAPTPATR